MAAYTEITEEEITKILSNYSLGRLIEFTPLSLGISNSNYRIEIKAEDQASFYLLKISNDKGQDQLRKEQLILEYLKEVSYPFSICSLKTNQGKYIYQLEHKFGVVFPFIKGIPPGPSDITCEEIGRGLATLHALQHTGNYEKIRSHTEVGFCAKSILDYSNDPKCPKDFKSFFKNMFPKDLSEYLNTSFEEGLIHGDLYYDNTLFDNNRLSAVLDFEQAGKGKLILDLGICISGTCLEKDRVSTPLIKSFLKGYEKVRSLPPEEMEFLNQSIIIGLFSISLWRIKRFKEGDLDPSMTDSYKELLQRAINFKNSLAELRRSPF